MINKSYGYPSEWKIPAQNSPGLNQPGRRDPQVSPASFADEIRRQDTAFNNKTDPNFADPKNLANMKWLRGVQLEQMAKNAERRGRRK